MPQGLNVVRSTRGYSSFLLSFLGSFLTALLAAPDVSRHSRKKPLAAGTASRMLSKYGFDEQSSTSRLPCQEKISVFFIGSNMATPAATGEYA